MRFIMVGVPHLDRLKIIFLATVLLFLSGCVTTPSAVEQADRLQPLNRKVHAFNNTLDQFSLRALASGYEKVVPSVVRRPVSNFFSNLSQVPSTVHSLIQGDLSNASESFMRFAINSTFGIGGIFDLATPMNITSRSEDMGQTLGKWKVPEGEYIVLPFLDASTVRDSVGLALSWFVLPLSVTALPPEMVLLNLVDTRVKLLPLDPIIKAQPDPYLFIRDAYRTRRRNAVANEVVVKEQDEEFWEDEFSEEFDTEFDNEANEKAASDSSSEVNNAPDSELDSTEDPQI